MLYAIVVLLILIADQAVKYWTTLSIPVNAESRSFIPGVIDITNIHNSGAAFGILRDADARWFFIVLAVAFVALVVWLLKADVIKGKFGRWMLVMVMAGGVGNCFDRVVSGYVVDMFSFAFWKSFPVFNVADIFISVCGVLFCIYLLRNRDDLSDKNIAEAAARAPRVPRPRRGEEPDPMADRIDYIEQLSRPVVEGRKNIEAEKLARELEKAEPELSVGPGDWVTPPEDLKTPTRREVQAARKEPRANPFESMNTAAGSAAADELFSASAPEAPAQPETPGAPDLFRGAAKAPAKPAADELLSDRPEKPKKDEGEYSVDDIIAEFKDK